MTDYTVGNFERLGAFFILLLLCGVISQLAIIAIPLQTGPLQVTEREFNIAFRVIIGGGFLVVFGRPIVTSLPEWYNKMKGAIA